VKDRHRALARNGGEGGARDSFAPGQSPPRRAGREPDGGRLSGYSGHRILIRLNGADLG
jgi:hypothetical protein